MWRTACSHCRECFFFFCWDRSLRLWLPRPRNVVDGASAPGQLHGRASRSVVPGAAAARHGVAVELNRTAARYPTSQDRTRWAMAAGVRAQAGPRLARRGVHRPVSLVTVLIHPHPTHMHACADEDGRACVADGQDSIAHLTSHDKHVAVGRASGPARLPPPLGVASGTGLPFLLEATTTGRPPALFRAELLQEPHTPPTTARPPTSNFSRAQFFSSIRVVGRGKSATQQAPSGRGRRSGGAAAGGRWLAQRGGKGTAGERI